MARRQAKVDRSTPASPAARKARPTPGAPRPLTHITPDGRAAMVDVGDKPITARSATAEALVRISPQLESRIREGSIAKGPVLEVARLAGIQAAKRTDELIPLCHGLPLDAVDVEATIEPGCIRLRATARTHARTGVEMEALTAVTVAALTVIDMGKAVDKAIVIEGVRILEKHGGRTGSYIAEDERTKKPGLTAEAQRPQRKAKK